MNSYQMEDYLLGRRNDVQCAVFARNLAVKVRKLRRVTTGRNLEGINYTSSKEWLCSKINEECSGRSSNLDGFTRRSEKVVVGEEGML